MNLDSTNDSQLCSTAEEKVVTPATPSAWQMFFDARNDLTPRDREEAYRKAQMATAYVWGWQGGRGYDADSQVATDFGLEYGLACCDFLAGRSFFLRSIPDSFTRFAGGEATIGGY